MLFVMVLMMMSCAVHAAFVSSSPSSLSQGHGVMQFQERHQCQLRQQDHHSLASKTGHVGPLQASITPTTIGLPSQSFSSPWQSDIGTESYKYQNWTLTYKYKPASRGYETAPPLLLIHPVGIGLSSWFWERFMELKGPAIYAPNLIGCGIHEKSDPWDPKTQQKFSIPLGWVEGCEAFMEHITTQRSFKQSDPFSAFLGNGIGSTKPSSWTIVTQGGLAPIGVLLADRNPTTVKNLIFMSPPTWKDMTTKISDEELTRNYEFYKHPIWGKLAFQLLESRRAVQLFSNLFLFGPNTKGTFVENEWLDKAMMECGELSRPPIMAFNAGLCNCQSYKQQLVSLQQSTLILQGDQDNQRHAQRKDYEKQMKDCRIQTIPGKNILAWDSPEETMRAILSSKFYQTQ
jgi:pimeloyl-ACP methyl ester carboxylesterase